MECDISPQSKGLSFRRRRSGTTRAQLLRFNNTLPQLSCVLTLRNLGSGIAVVAFTLSCARREYMRDELPVDMTCFLKAKAGHRLAWLGGEIESVCFFSAESLELGRFYVNSATLYSAGQLAVDPGDEKCFLGYSLLRDSDHYDPFGILVWFIDFSCLGTADTEHR